MLNVACYHAHTHTHSHTVHSHHGLLLAGSIRAATLPACKMPSCDPATHPTCSACEQRVRQRVNRGTSVSVQWFRRLSSRAGSASATFPGMRELMRPNDIMQARPLVTITFSSIDGYRDICGGWWARMTLAVLAGQHVPKPGSSCVCEACRGRVPPPPPLVPHPALDP